MQPDPTDSSTDNQASIFASTLSTSQHGLLHNHPPALSPSGDEEDEGNSESRSEWTLSPSTSGLGSPESDDAGLSPNSPHGSVSQFDLTHPGLLVLHDANNLIDSLGSGPLVRDDNRSRLHDFPEEMLFHVVSHLPASDLLTLKLVSRRFYTLVTSPQAWMNAFTRFFRGTQAQDLTEDTERSSEVHGLVREQRLFTRLAVSGSWSSEYLIRTRLLRCLTRGRPSLPFAAPSPGKLGKGSATFTFSSRLTFGCSNMHADFGSPFDKRKPQFIHGIASTGSVTSSDRKGKFDSWGFINHVAFKHFAETHPGFAPYGLGNGDLVGVPNMMDVSQTYGVVYGEGTLGGNIYYLGTDERHGRYLAPFVRLSHPELGIPRIVHATQSTCSVWLAKSSAVPRLTNGLIGILAGSSTGIISAYSLGTQGNRGQRHARGQLTARWLLSPGVPIIALLADDNVTNERAQRHRTWAAALNALGEVFSLSAFPEQELSGASSPNDEALTELRAWQVGDTATWKLVKASSRTLRHPDPRAPSNLDHLPERLWPVSTPLKDGFVPEAQRMENWLSRVPMHFRLEFSCWDMRRYLIFDFGNTDDDGAGELAIVTSSGSDDESSPSIARYSRCLVAREGSDAALSSEKESQLPRPDELSTTGPIWSFATISKGISTADMSASMETIRVDDHRQDVEDVWRTSRLLFGSTKTGMINTTAMDDSNLAMTTSWEDDELRSKVRKRSASGDSDTFQRQIPGQRARLFAAGTSTGTIFVWNARAAFPRDHTLVYDVSPVRVIRTDSPGISSLALTALYLVHGGEEGLVQAWDLLASTVQPLRTLSSRHAINNRRRAVLAAQQNPVANMPPQSRQSLAASAICLDPDPTVLRGIVAIGAYLKYWSYSSIAAEDDLSRSQKRRLKRGSNKGANGGSMEGMSYTSTGRRADVKNFLSQELHQRVLDERENRKEAKEDRRIAGRFGLNLLGEDASEEELLAYAKILSEEDHERQLQRSAASTVKATVDVGAIDADESLEAQKDALSDADTEKWKFVSWQERHDMLRDRGLQLSRSQASTQAPSTPTPASRSTLPSSSNINYDADSDLAEALALSLTHEPQTSSPTSSSPELPISLQRAQADRRVDSDDADLARAIRLSLQDAEADRTPVETLVNDDDAFPALGSSSSPPSSGGERRATGRGKGKGKARRG